MEKIVQRVFGNTKLNMALVGVSTISFGILTANVIDKNNEIEELSNKVVLSEKENEELLALNKNIVVKNEKMTVDLENLNKVVKEKDSKIEADKETIRLLTNTNKTLKEKVNKLESEKKTTNPVASRGSNQTSSTKTSNVDSSWQTFRMSHYGADCSGCSGTTASGVNVKSSIYYNGMRIIASDPSIIPLGSIVEISENGGSPYKAIVLDTGGAIKGYKLDMLVSSERESLKHGVKHVKLKIVRKGW